MGLAMVTFGEDYLKELNFSVDKSELAFSQTAKHSAKQHFRRLFLSNIGQ